jgi:hypothetical protein
MYEVFNKIHGAAARGKVVEPYCEALLSYISL